MARQKIRLYLKHGHVVTVEAEEFSVTRDRMSGAATEWSASGVKNRFGFNPDDLVFWEVLS